MLRTSAFGGGLQQGGGSFRPREIEVGLATCHPIEPFNPLLATVLSAIGWPETSAATVRY
jgi:hypothetical protein